MARGEARTPLNLEIVSRDRVVTGFNIADVVYDETIGQSVGFVGGSLGSPLSHHPLPAHKRPLAPASSPDPRPGSARTPLRRERIARPGGSSRRPAAHPKTATIAEGAEDPPRPGAAHPVL